MLHFSSKNEVGRKVIYCDRRGQEREGVVVGERYTDQRFFRCLMTVIRDSETGEEVERQWYKRAVE